MGAARTTARSVSQPGLLAQVPYLESANLVGVL
jgi:hypothetical protein